MDSAVVLFTALTNDKHMNEIALDEDFREICKRIRDRRWTKSEWSKHCYEDMFQYARFNGGFEADEGPDGLGAFWFSWYDSDDREWWFEVTLEEAIRFAEGSELRVHLMPSPNQAMRDAKRQHKDKKNM